MILRMRSVSTSDQILASLAHARGPLTVTQLVERTGRSEMAVRDNLQVLMSEGFGSFVMQVDGARPKLFVLTSRGHLRVASTPAEAQG